MTQGLVEEGVAPASREDEPLRRSFIRLLRAEGISPTRVQRYELSVRQFHQFAQRMEFPGQVTREHVTHFLGWRRQGHVSNTAGNDYIALSRYFKWLLEEDEVRENPMIRVKPPPLHENLPRPYTPDEIRAMLRVCQGKDPQSLRGRAVILVRVDTGLRASELCSLKVADADLNGEHIIVRGKRGKERLVRLGYKAQAAVASLSLVWGMEASVKTSGPVCTSGAIRTWRRTGWSTRRLILPTRCPALVRSHG
jgi:integrase/recombinase XerC